MRKLLRYPRRRTVVLLALLAVVGLGHGALLRLAAWPLTAADTASDSDYYCLHGSEWGPDGYKAFDAAAEWHKRQPDRKILVILRHVSRSVEIGALPSLEQVCHKELGKRGVSSQDIWPIPTDACDNWKEIHGLARWLRQRPAATVTLACGSFCSGRLRFMLNKVLGTADAGRVRVLELADPSCRGDNWWRSRNGVKAFMFAWLDLFYTWAKGDHSGPTPAGAAAFQESVRAEFGKAPP